MHLILNILKNRFLELLVVTVTIFSIVMNMVLFPIKWNIGISEMIIMSLISSTVIMVTVACAIMVTYPFKFETNTKVQSLIGKIDPNFFMFVVCLLLEITGIKLMFHHSVLMIEGASTFETVWNASLGSFICLSILAVGFNKMKEDAEKAPDQKVKVNSKKRSVKVPEKLVFSSADL